MAQTKPDFVHIVIVNYKGHRHTIECLESLFKQTHLNFQVIVVDNSEAEDSVNHIVSWCNGEVTEVSTLHPEIIYPLVPKKIRFKVINENEDYDVNTVDQLILIKAQKNNGFAGANNVGINYIAKQPNFDWLWLLNNDTIVLPNCIENFFNTPNMSPKTGILGTKLYYYDTGKMQGIGGKFNKWLGTVKHVGFNETDNGQYDHTEIEQLTDYIIGASMFVSKAFIKSVGLMSEEYFLYFEELDWIERGRSKGWKFGLLPDCIVLHKEGATISGNENKSIINDICSVKSRIIFTQKFYPSYLFSIYASLFIVFLNRLKRLQFNRIVLLYKVTILNRSVKEVLGIL